MIGNAGAASSTVPFGRRNVAPIGVSNQTEPAFVHRPVMPPAQQNKVVDAGRTAIHPVLQMMGIAAARHASREPATPVPRLKRSPDRCRHSARLAPDIENCPVGTVTHLHHRCVAGHATGRFRGNVDHAVVHLHRARIFPCRHTDRHLHVQHHLVAVPSRPTIRCSSQRTRRTGAAARATRRWRHGVAPQAAQWPRPGRAVRRVRRREVLVRPRRLADLRETRMTCLILASQKQIA
jgi:hypothetical protein